MACEEIFNDYDKPAISKKKKKRPNKYLLFFSIMEMGLWWNGGQHLERVGSHFQLDS